MAIEPPDQNILARRALSRDLDREQRKRERPHRHRLKERHKPRTWPLDAETLTRADIDPGDVSMPRLQPPAAIETYKMAAAGATGEIVADPNLVIYRHHESVRERELREALRGPAWTPEIVDMRIIQAWHVFWRVRDSKARPRGFGSAMPRPVIEIADLVAQAENRSLSQIMSRMLRRHGAPTAEETSRMNAAICWSIDYLSSFRDPEIPLFFNMGGQLRATNGKVVSWCRDRDVEPRTFYRKRKIAIEAVVAGLTRDGKAAT